MGPSMIHQMKPAFTTPILTSFHQTLQGRKSTSPSRRPTPYCSATRPNPPKSPPSEGSSNADVNAAPNIGESLKDSPILNSTLLNAMRDYFGDDGREIQDYIKRPRNDSGEPMFRVLIIGSESRELELAKRLHDSGVIMGLYYSPDQEAVCDLDMSKYGQSTFVSANFSMEEVVAFAQWSVSDAVFIGPDKQGCVDKESEKALATAEITLFQHDVSEAIAEGQLDVRDCLRSIAEKEEETESSAEQLVE